MFTKPLKENLNRNKLSIGSWICIGHPAIAEIMSGANFEWLVIDLEHTVISLSESAELIRAIQAQGVTPLVRLTSNDPNQIKRMMDAGAEGVVVPMVNNRAMAEQAVAAVKYPPKGTRGVGLARAQNYGFGFEEYARTVNDKSVVIVQIEHIDAINDLENILSVDGVDGSIIGPYDLSGSMGKPGKFDDPDVIAVIKRYEDISRKLGKPMGFHVVSPDSALLQSYIQRGYSFLAFSTDFLFLGDNCRKKMKELELPPPQK